jgi:hypothetical protein
MSINGSRGLSGFHLDRSKGVVAVSETGWRGRIGPDNFGSPPFQPTTQLVVENPQSDALRLSGELDCRHIRLPLHRTKPNFILQSRCFQWIHESAIWRR